VSEPPPISFVNRGELREGERKIFFFFSLLQFKQSMEDKNSTMILAHAVEEQEQEEEL